MKMDLKNLGLRVGFWNIDGLNEQKLGDSLFESEGKKFDILFLTEIWKSIMAMIM